MHTYDGRMAAPERRLAVRVLQEVVPRAFAILEELSVTSALPLRCERLYLVGRGDQTLEISADHAETDVALVDYWRLRVTDVSQVPSAATVLRSLFDAAVTGVEFASDEELLEEESEHISSHSRIVLRQASSRSIVISPASGVSGAIQLNVEV
jgi:hypothetical protein